MSIRLQEIVEYHRQRTAEEHARREALRSRVLTAVRAAIPEVAQGFSAVQALHLFGSILQPGRFSEHSDIDVAIDCTDVFVEGRFRRELERRCEWRVDLRPCVERVAEAVELSGEKVYERKVPAA